LYFTEGTAYNPAISSDNTAVGFTLPFNFKFLVDIKSLDANITISAGGASIADLVLSNVSTITEVQQRVIHLTFSNIPFTAFGDEHGYGAFQRFLASTMMATNQPITLSGKANAITETAIGLLSLKGVEFSVDTSITGLRDLTMLVTSLDLSQGFPSYLLIKVDALLINPRLDVLMFLI
jgi:hypothetical protein